MFGQRFSKKLVALFSAVMLVTAMLPLPALAAESQVRVEDYEAASAEAQVISDLVIGDVDAPKAGEELDDTATVRSAQGTSWDVLVLWIDQDLQLATTAFEDGAYLPAIAFFVPEAYQVRATDDAFFIELSDELAELYGENEVVSVYDASTGIIYILPAHLRDYFTTRTDLGEGSGSVEALAIPSPETQRTIIDVFCSQTARDSFGDEELEWFLDLVINKLQPQAINLLLEKFPAFAEAAAKGEIGTEIGLYVYYKAGDQDGILEHSSASSGVLGAVSGRAVPVGDSYHFGYMVSIDISSLVKKDENDTPVTDPATGKYVLVRDGEDMETFENTIVHEHFHALMYDYNRVGMTGSVNMSDFVLTPDGKFRSEEQAESYYFTKLPTWFVEGSASSVENVYMFRIDKYEVLRMKGNVMQSAFDMSTLVDNYIDGKMLDGTPYYHDLWYADGVNEKNEEIKNEASAYAMGYLAVLYLSELQARQNGKTAISGDQDKVVSSEVLRGGLNDILKRLHEGETLDEVINSISPVVDGKKAYSDTTEFQKKFIKGSFYTNGGAVENGRYADQGDYANGQGSAPFVVDVLNYFERIGKQEGRTNGIVNGSILFDFERDYASPLDGAANDQSEYLKIVEANTTVVSTAPDSVALKDGGKSASGTPGHDSAKPTTKDEYPIADIQTGPAPAAVNANGGSGDLAASANAGSGDVQAASVEAASAPIDSVQTQDAAEAEALPLAAKAPSDSATVDATNTDASA